MTNAARLQRRKKSIHVIFNPAVHARPVRNAGLGSPRWRNSNTSVGARTGIQAFFGTDCCRVLKLRCIKEDLAGNK